MRILERPDRRPYGLADSDMEAPRTVGERRGSTATSESRLPTVLRSGPYRFFHYVADHGEPPHVHVERDELEAKLWLDPVKIANPGHFKPVELRRIERIVEEHRYVLLERWDADFGV